MPDNNGGVHVRYRNYYGTVNLNEIGGNGLKVVALDPKAYPTIVDLNGKFGPITLLAYPDRTDNKLLVVLDNQNKPRATAAHIGGIKPLLFDARSTAYVQAGLHFTTVQPKVLDDGDVCFNKLTSLYRQYLKTTNLLLTEENAQIKQVMQTCATQWINQLPQTPEKKNLSMQYAQSGISWKMENMFTDKQLPNWLKQKGH